MEGCELLCGRCCCCCGGGWPPCAAAGLLYGVAGGRGCERDGTRVGRELRGYDTMADCLFVLLGAVQEGSVAALHDQVGVDIVLPDAGIGGQVGVGVRTGRVAY